MGSTGQATMGWFPWQAHYASQGTYIRVEISTFLGMGESRDGTGTQNNYIEWQQWMDVGTWKFCLVHRKDSDAAIYSVRLDAVEQGTIDGYAAATAANTYSEITGISVTTAGVKTLRLQQATKNASSGGYKAYLQSIALIKTAGTASTPSGTDTPGYTWELAGAWMGHKAVSGTWGRNQNSAYLSGGILQNDSGAQQNTYVEWDIWQEARTYKFAMISDKAQYQGVAHIRLEGSDVGTIDTYAAAGVNNQYAEITGIAVAAAGVKTFQIKMATKNASSANYSLYLNSAKWISTGA